ncbi:GL25013 [Drosophila persimilis]|uniref:GL25013 n=1 Tax=Drosophila persimilis TaxID=7234 RepID=B4GR66_DROPE|nr:GL25013 [Drosophila persimilis]
MVENNRHGHKHGYSGTGTGTGTATGTGMGMGSGPFFILLHHNLPKEVQFNNLLDMAILFRYL